MRVSTCAKVVGLVAMVVELATAVLRAVDGEAVAVVELAATVVRAVDGSAVAGDVVVADIGRTAAGVLGGSLRRCPPPQAAKDAAAATDTVRQTMGRKRRRAWLTP
jgi:hypothetical protein